MAEKKELKTYKGSQILKDEKYNNRIARIVINPEKTYSLEDVEKQIENYLKKKGDK